MSADVPARALPRIHWRALDGIVLLDKPVGLGSTPALQRARRLLRAAKGGHAGTLDPAATGMLPLCFGQATKACGLLLAARKAYRARLALGASTNTGDAAGKVLLTQTVPPLDRPAVEAVLASFRGTRLQVPPMYSALKRDGRPLHELARRGETVERAPREVTLHRLELLDLAADSVEFEVECSKGTYVRVLGEELAAALGTAGHLAALRRLWVSPFDPARMVTLETVEAWAAGSGGAPEARPDWLLPVDAAFVDLPRLDLAPEAARRLCQGQRVVSEGGGEAGLLRVYASDGGAFLGLVRRDAAAVLQVERLFVGAPDADRPPDA